MTSTTALLECGAPPDTGRTDLMLTARVQDLETFSTLFTQEFVPNGHPDITLNITNLAPYSDYLVTIVTSNGVSDQSPDGDESRSAFTLIFTSEGGNVRVDFDYQLFIPDFFILVPNAPFLKRLCTVVIWKPPTEPLGQIVSYTLCFGSCNDEITDRECHSLTADDNFFVTSEVQRQNDVYVQVKWSLSVSYQK